MSAKIGIRLEDKNPWETRVALVPDDVKRLTEAGLDLEVQRFARRAFPDDAYIDAGATLVDDVGNCGLVLGIKEMPPGLFRENGAYMFFSHTIKGQPHNMDLLAALVDKRCTLLDYETVTDADGRRLIFFGRYAGLAGMVDTLWALGRRLAARGITSPFVHLEPCHRYGDTERAKAAIREVGERITSVGIPEELAPLVIGVTGYGHVSSGVQEILDELPLVEVEPEDLAEFVASQRGLTRRVAKVVYREEHLVKPRDGSRAFDLAHYFENGEEYESVFGPNLGLLSVLVNAIYWDEKYPKLATAGQFRDLYSRDSPRLIAVGDITCDVDGSLECTVRDTDPADPAFVYDPETRAATSGFEGNGPVVMAVSNLPCELPVAASGSFSRTLTPFMEQMAAADWAAADVESAGLPDPIKRSVILWHGEFTPEFSYMENFVR